MAQKATVPKHLRKLMKALGPGWEWQVRNNNHGRIVAPDGRHVDCSVSPKNRDHAVRNVAKDIKRYLGVEVEHRT